MARPLLAALSAALLLFSAGALKAEENFTPISFEFGDTGLQDVASDAEEYCADDGTCYPVEAVVCEADGSCYVEEEVDVASELAEDEACGTSFTSKLGLEACAGKKNRGRDGHRSERGRDGDHQGNYGGHHKEKKKKEVKRKKKKGKDHKHEGKNGKNGGGKTTKVSGGGGHTVKCCPNGTYRIFIKGQPRCSPNQVAYPKMHQTKPVRRACWEQWRKTGTCGK